MSKKNDNTILYVALAGAAAYFLLKKPAVATTVTSGSTGVSLLQNGGVNPVSSNPISSGLLSAGSGLLSTITKIFSPPTAAPAGSQPLVSSDNLQSVVTPIAITNPVLQVPNLTNSIIPDTSQMFSQPLFDTSTLVDSGVGPLNIDDTFFPNASPVTSPAVVQDMGPMIIQDNSNVIAQQAQQQADMQAQQAAAATAAQQAQQQADMQAQQAAAAAAAAQQAQKQADAAAAVAQQLQQTEQADQAAQAAADAQQQADIQAQQADAAAAAAQQAQQQADDAALAAAVQQSEQQAAAAAAQQAQMVDVSGFIDNTGPDVIPADIQIFGPDGSDGGFVDSSQIISVNDFSGGSDGFNSDDFFN
jgi:pyruvate/2-oxoglutarate dehydrogenase complex dihydrolipoamide acyltransferase (E2) component